MKKYFSLAVASLALLSCVKEKQVTITVENKSSLARNNEIVEVDWNLVKENLKLAPEQTFIVVDELGQQVPYQLVSNGNEAPELLIFPATLAAEQSQSFNVMAGTPDSVANRVEVNFVPQRKDDISWENDRVSFRAYGPALEIDSVEPLISGGTDIWVKSTPNLVTQRWYKDELEKHISYHEDHGEGLDFYSVGRSLGCGAAAPICADSLVYITHNFTSYEILDNGPLRCVFKLTYAPYDVCGQTVSETRVISLDAGSNLNKVVENYGDVKTAFNIGAGFPYYGNDNMLVNAEEGFFTYTLDEVADKGVIYQAVVSEMPLLEVKEISKQMAAVMAYDPAVSGADGLTYYSGGGWNNGGFATVEDWNSYVADFAARLKNPLIVSVK